jgi:nucleoid-associated protein YgaU
MNKSLVSKTTLIVGTLFAMPSLYGAEAVYEVQKGDTLGKIALEFSRQYSELNWHSSLELIKEINAEKFEDYDRIHVGQKVRLPDQDYVHTYLAGMKSTSHSIVKRKPFNPQKNLVKNLTRDQGGRVVAQDTVNFRPGQNKKPDNYTIEDAKKLEIKNAKGFTVNPRDLKEVPETVEPETKIVEKTVKVTKPMAQVSNSPFKAKQDSSVMVKAKPVVEQKIVKKQTPVKVKPVVKKQTPVVAQVEKKEGSQSIKTYLIKKGDTLSEIALHFFGAKKLYDYNAGPMKKIMELNPTVKNPDMIFAGTQLTLPGRNVASDPNDEPVQVESQPKLDKKPEDELFWSQKERQDSLNPDFSYIDFEEMIDIEFQNSDDLIFKVG